jgi:hypothetical protein
MPHVKLAEHSEIKDGIPKRINELETNSRNKNTKDLHTDINEYKGRYQPRTNFIKDENGDLMEISTIF